MTGCQSLQDPRCHLEQHLSYTDGKHRPERKMRERMFIAPQPHKIGTYRTLSLSFSQQCSFLPVLLQGRKPGVRSEMGGGSTCPRALRVFTEPACPARPCPDVRGYSS